MLNPVLTAVAQAANASIWALLVLVGAVVLITVLALILAPRADVVAVFRAFASAFGLRALDQQSSDNEEQLDDTGPAQPVHTEEQRNNDGPDHQTGLQQEAETVEEER
ncbi:hypothetical protein [Nocardia alba]|uniref:Uncharacterized protein n=1 Tax=Nocardia alba TaxID=225051 RepID=A0A4R1FB49_9NOCA|nr:hypothetical protein [Nocardia alba]TCJ89929.1 hypothetical protein DFR71_6219 [Nocardia alba]